MQVCSCALARIGRSTVRDQRESRGGKRSKGPLDRLFLHKVEIFPTHGESHSHLASPVRPCVPSFASTVLLSAKPKGQRARLLHQHTRPPPTRPRSSATRNQNTRNSIASSDLDNPTYLKMVTSTQTALLVQGSRVIYLTGEGSPPFPTSDSPPSPTSDSPPSPASDSPSFPASDFGSRSTTPDSFQQNFGYGEPEYDFDCDSDMSDSASLSPSYHSAGQGSARHYRAQLKRNEITALDFFADDYFRLGKFAFPPEALTPQVSLSRDGSRCGCFELNSLPDLLS